MGTMSAAEQTTTQATAGVSAAAAFLASMQDVAMGVLGVPLASVFGAFAGTCYGVTMGHTMKPSSLVLSVLATTSIAAIGSPLILSYFFPAAPAAATAGAAALGGFLLQYGAPWLRENRQRLMEKWLGGPKG
jgi:hypothetical protein